jgi:CHASE3 domain sensor protein
MKTTLETAGSQAAAMTSGNQARLWMMGVRAQEQDQFRIKAKEAQEAAEFWRWMFFGIGLPAIFAVIYLVYMTFPRGQ